MTRYRALFGLCLLAALAPVAAAQNPPLIGTYGWGLGSVSNDNVALDSINGVLTTDGEGGIEWEATAPEDQVAYGPAPAAQAYAAWSLHAYTGGALGQDLIPALQFTSAPFPEDIYVDVGRVVQVNAIVRVSNCFYVASQFSLEARINGELWGGMPRGLADSVAAVDKDPSPPPGWCLARFRFHSEADTISPGDVITITIYYHHQSYLTLTDAPAISIGGDNPSGIRIPYYPIDEAVLRRPEFQETSGAPVVVGMGGLAGLLLMPAAKRRGLVGLLVLVPLLAGCSSGGSVDPPQDEGGSQTYTIQPADPGAGQGDLGMIVGLVSNLQSIPVGGAHVALLGTDASAQTDKRGKFTFADLAAGTYAYRVDHPAHRSFEGEVEVQEGAVTRLDVQLQFRDNRTGDQLAHRHTMWPASGTKVLLNRTVAENVVCATANDGLFLRGQQCLLPFFLPAADPNGDPVLVPPGTQRLEVTISWEGGTGQQAGVFFVPNGEPYTGNFWNYVNQTVMWPRGSGEMTTIQVPWEMTDVGHQRFSVWEWGIWFPLYAGTSLGLPEARAFTYEGPLHVKVEAFKGVVPLEPPHPDHWGGQDSVVVVDGQTGNYGFASPRPVPPETKWLEITLERDRRTIEPNELLFYTAADTPSAWAHPDREERRVVFPDPDALKQYVRWPLIPHEADPPYAKSSLWSFEFRRPGENLDPGAFAGNLHESVQGQTAFSLTVVAHRTDVPADAADRTD